ncbi:ABC transporter ATP-binding protein [Breoghania sp. L-A4]|uniref:ABC transporter ATP-binding protein n=1 Tax=Breoghania sp. L-A4 TaxID=2304600 RepID=UPI000E35E75A|nr:ABC transporter ATP-binding protein [Breoghania sp. L-A4]AXS42160.1 ABC transporter ATP-binding protein [Breoghania sp. L-A4]
MHEALLEVEALDAFYGDFQALFSVSATLRQGEALAVIGANGAGKSTLLKTITGLLPCEASAVRYRGEAIGGRVANRISGLGIAMVPEGRRLFPSLSVEENLRIGGERARPGRWRLKTVYDLFPVLAERRNAPSTALSGGQQQMVAIGRALMSNPELILFDEISLGLAPVVIRDIYDALPAIIGEGTSCILVEQDISRALSVADTVICMQEGRVSLEGKPADLTRQAISAAYFGE